MISNFADLVEKTSRDFEPDKPESNPFNLVGESQQEMSVLEQKFNDSSKTTEQKPKQESLNTSKIKLELTR